MTDKPGKKSDLDILEKRAASGDKDATTNLAILYELGLGDVPQDMRKARELWQKASEKGSGLADFSLAKILASGDGGTTVDKEQAEKYRMRAAEAGFMDPHLKLLLAKDESGMLAIRPETKGRKILVADGTGALRTDMQLILKEFGLDIVFTANGKEALALIEKDRRIELLITDINLKALEGLTLVEKLKSHPELYRIPIVVITNDGSKPSILKGKSFGIAAWLLKPPHAETIQKLVGKLLTVKKKAA